MTEFRIQDIFSKRPDEVSKFISALAKREPWALAAFDAKQLEHPFDRLASYWAAASQEIKLAISRGLLDFFDVACRDLQQFTADAVRDALAFCAIAVADLPIRYSGPFVPYLRSWLFQDLQPLSKLAAVALASIRTLDALSVLADFAVRRSYPTWILPALIEARAHFDPAAAFDDHDKWLAASIDDPAIQVALRNAVKLAAVDAPKAAQFLAGLLTQHSEETCVIIERLMQEARLEQLPSFRSIISKTRGGDFIIKPRDTAAQVVHTLENIYARLSDAGGEQYGRAEWRRLFNDLKESGERVDELWSFVHLFCANLSGKPRGNQFFDLMKRSVITSEFRTVKEGPADLIREAQRSYLHKEISLRSEHVAAERVIVERLVKRMPRKVDMRHLPPRIQIPTVNYAEEAYLEMLSILVRAWFGIPVVRVKDCEWDELQAKFAQGDADIGLNNDDILALPDAHVTEVYKLESPLYKIRGFDVIGRKSFLRTQGIDSDLITKAAVSGGYVLNEPSVESDHQLARLIDGGKIRVPGGTLLESDLRKFAKAHNVAQDQIKEEAPDVGLADFLNGEVELYFGGRLQTSFALRAHSDLVRVAKLSVPLTGHLFARKEFFADYPMFFIEFSNVMSELRYAMYENPTKQFVRARETLLTTKLNSALLAGSKHTLALVGSYDELKEALEESVLLPTAHSPWAPWTKDMAKTLERQTPTVAADTG